jgi:hypothetical protein
VETEIVKADAQLETGLAKLRSEAIALVVKDGESYKLAQTLALAAKSYIKDVGRKLDPGIDSAKDHLNKLKNDKQAYVTPAEHIVLTLKTKADTWRLEEERKTAEETRRVNEQRRIEAQRKADEDRRIAEAEAESKRKAEQKQIDADREAGLIKAREANRLKKQAEEDAARAKLDAKKEADLAVADVQDVKVESNVPKVAGVQRRTNYYAEVTDAAALISAFEDGDETQRDFLRQFITVNEPAVGKYAREAKDPKKVEQSIPGVKAWSGF